MAVVAFDFNAWTTRFGEFLGVDPAFASALFDEAGLLFINNTDGSPVQDVNQRTTLLYLLTAHMAKLYAPARGSAPNSRMVGRIANAGEGSVSVTNDIGQMVTGQAWFMQTQYGAQFWQATAWLRRGRYYQGPSRLNQPGFPGMTGSPDFGNPLYYGQSWG